MQTTNGATVNGASNGARLVDLPQREKKETPVEAARWHQDRPLAPAPAIDRFPVVQGSNLTLSYIASASRLALSGYRYAWVDVLGELLDLEPHGFSVMSKRVLAVAGARIELTVPKHLPDGAKARAEEILQHCSAQLAGMRNRVRAAGTLLWGLYYGPCARENFWTRRGGEWWLTDTGFIHSRRLSYPNYGSWDLFVWDQGMAVPYDDPLQQAVGAIAPLRGLRLDDYPGKFITFVPQLRGDYPTREGIGRIIAVYMALKRLIMRMTFGAFERFFKAWAVAYFRTGTAETKFNPRAATPEDKNIGLDAVKNLGIGSMASAMLPDSVKLELIEAIKSLDRDALLAYLDAAMSKAALGQSHTTEPGQNGNRSASETAKEDTRELSRYDAALFAEAVTDGWMLPMVRYNYPGQEALAPEVTVVVERPDPKKLVEVWGPLADRGAAIDADRVCEIVGAPVVPNDTGKPRILRPIKQEDAAPATQEEAEELAQRREEMQQQMQQQATPDATGDRSPVGERSRGADAPRRDETDDDETPGEGEERDE